MTLRLDEGTNNALRHRADVEGRSMQEVVKSAVAEYLERHERIGMLERVLDSELPRYAEALKRLGE